MAEKSDKIYEFENFRLDLSEQTLWRENEAVALTPKVFDLLVVLVGHPGHLLSKDELIKTLWPDSFVEEANLNVTVSALRRALGEKPAEHRFIETVPRRGYRFVADVRQPADDGAGVGITPSFGEGETLKFLAEDGELPLSDIQPDGFESKQPGYSAFQKNPRAVVLLGGLLLAAAAFAGLIIWKFVLPPEKTGVSNIRTIAVLPFRPLVEDQGDEALEIGMTDALITKLSNLEQITLRPTSTVAKYAGADPLAAGRELQVEAVLDGTMQRADNRIRVTVQLLRVADGATLWAESFDDFYTNIFAVQDSISEKMTASLALKLSGREKELLAKRFTENTEAYALYLKGRYYHEKISEEGSRKAIEYYQAAVQKDPEYAMAYAWTTGPLIHLATLGIDRQENLRKAREVATKAVGLDPHLPDAHEALATVYDAIDWNFAEAEGEYRRAIELDPKNADAHYSYAGFLSRFENRLEEAVREIETAKQLNPVAIYMQIQSVIILMRARRFDEAIAGAKEITELNPGFQQTYFILTKLYLFKSMPAEAEAALKKFREISSSQQQYLTALVYYHTGRKEAAKKMARELLGKYRTGDNCYSYALLYLMSGDKDRTFEFLEKAHERREVPLLTIGVDPEWDELRSDPRFQDLRQRIGLLPG